MAAHQVNPEEADGADETVWMRQSESDPIETTFELNDTLYAKAEIPPTDEVYLWLGVCLVAVDSKNLRGERAGVLTRPRPT